MSGLSADLYYITAVRECVDNRLSRLLACHGIIGSAEEISVLLALCCQVRGEKSYYDTGFFRFHQSRYNRLRICRVDNDSVYTLCDTGADSVSSLLSVASLIVRGQVDSQLFRFLFCDTAGIRLRLIRHILYNPAYSNAVAGSRCCVAGVLGLCCVCCCVSLGLPARLSACCQTTDHGRCQ